MNKFPYIFAIALCLTSGSSVIAETTVDSNRSSSTPSLSFNRDNAVYGIKDGRLYAYVDLAGNASALKQLPAETLTKLVLDASVKAASEWWKAPRFSKLDSGIIDIITILNKDEYAKADFSSALMHGKVFLRRTKAGVVVESHTLNFDNLRSARVK